MFQNAEIHFKISCKLKEPNVPALLCLGELYLQIGEQAKAKEAYTDVLTNDHKNPIALKALNKFI